MQHLKSVISYYIYIANYMSPLWHSINTDNKFTLHIKLISKNVLQDNIV